MNSSKPFSLRLFGSPSLAGHDGTIVIGRAVQRHRLALLALLALAAGHRSTRDKLLGYLWPESDAERGRQLLNQAVYHLRKALGEDAIFSAGDELRLNVDLIATDVTSFEAAVARGDMTAAAALYQGPLLDGFFLNDAPEFERWIDRERERLSSAYANALESIAEAAEAHGDHRGAAEWWRMRAAHDPYDSRVALRLMQALEASGNRAGALQHVSTHARVLADEFGIAPSPDVAALAERLRAEPTAMGVGVEDAAPSPPHLVASTPASAHTIEQRPETADAAAIVTGPVSKPATSLGTHRTGYAALALLAATLAATSLWLWGRDADTRWLAAAMPRIEDHLAVADWETAFRLTREAKTRVPNSREVDELWPRVSWRVTLASEPAGATVYRQVYSAAGGEWEELGRTPLVDIRIPYGLSRVRLELAGYRPLVRAIGGAHINWSELTPAAPDMLLVGPETYRLDTDRTLPADMVRVPGWDVTLGGEETRLNDFFLGRYEVTNAEFKAFVDAGGYQQPEYWDPVVRAGGRVPWTEAMKSFVDRTGRPGPSTWEAGDYPSGEAELPVSGVSWYEAAAYARFAGRELPTAHHWQQALANAMFPWLLPLSNFSGDKPRRVRDSAAMTHVGAYDLTGNVREWTASASGSERIILGGSWNDPYYIAGESVMSAPPEDRSAGNGIRVALTRDDPAVADRVRAPIPASTTAAAVVEQKPVSDEVYAAYGRVFDYDRRPLDAAILDRDTTRLWIRERIQLDAGYGTGRMLVHLYLPRAGTLPYQAVVYWPGWDTFTLTDADEYFAKQVDFIVKGGRAVAFPIFHGTFERASGSTRRRPDFGTVEYRDNTIQTVKELRRTIDYLHTRRDIDRNALGFFGYSWGGVNGPTAMAQEPRIRAAVIYVGLLPGMAATPEVDPVNALPRVRVPTLLLSGEFDAMVPRQNAQRYFDLIGVPASRKRHVIAIGGHFVPRHLLIRETLDWLDRHLGAARR